MDDLQYLNSKGLIASASFSFKPCYKWMTFNTNRLTELELKGAPF